MRLKKYEKYGTLSTFTKRGLQEYVSQSRNPVEPIYPKINPFVILTITVLNVSHCQCKPFKVPPNSMQKVNLTTMVKHSNTETVDKLFSRNRMLDPITMPIQLVTIPSKLAIKH